MGREAINFPPSNCEIDLADTQPPKIANKDRLIDRQTEIIVLCKDLQTVGYE